MNVNDDFSIRAVVHGAEAEWIASPLKGVDRRLLDRIGDEVARATSIVRYAPGSSFSAHTHTGGEEFLVLDGVFQDEHGDFPAGTYVRNPPQSSHTPGAAQGCTIFVKLWQFDPADRTHIRIDTNKIGAVADAERPGTEITPLYKDTREDVRMERWQANAPVALDVPHGLEVFVVSGSFEEGGETFAQHSWLRLPRASKLAAQAGAEGAYVWVKSGHLKEAPQAPHA